ncbi:MAG: beta-ketoacyl synthase chain length factor [Bacteroidales bacterium]|nr:beta-ketoacyl synthase chain length factor [Bacteroidales bacterium]
MNKRIYINGVGCLSPQLTLDNRLFLEEPVSTESNRLKAIDANYKEFVPPEMVRRMGRIIKMGVAAAKTCLADAGCQMPDAIITGTGLGCIEDTEKFLGNMIKNNEEFLTPTAFIQSTHNTVSAQIALLVQCHGYNFTYVHRGFSFESAILDSLLQIENGRASTVLLGTADELTANSLQIQKRLGFWRRNPIDNLKLFDHPDKGTIAGEGAVFFLLDEKKNSTTYTVLQDVEMLFMPHSADEIRSQINGFLNRNGISESDISLLLVGQNGDTRHQKVYDEVAEGSFPNVPACGFKHLCGEYMTASSFGVWLAAKIMKEQRIPEILQVSKKPSELKHILLYNHYQGINHSLILLSQP